MTHNVPPVRLMSLSPTQRSRYRAAVALDRIGSGTLQSILAEAVTIPGSLSDPAADPNALRIALTELVVVGWVVSRVEGLDVLYALSDEGRVQLHRARAGILEG